MKPAKRLKTRRFRRLAAEEARQERLAAVDRAARLAAETAEWKERCLPGHSEPAPDLIGASSTTPAERMRGELALYELAGRPRA